MAEITVTEFLQEKADNFRKFLTANNPDAELEQQMKSYQPSLIVPTVATFLVPLYMAGQLNIAVNDILSHLSPADVEATRNKVTRYLECFIETVTSAT